MTTSTTKITCIAEQAFSLENLHVAWRKVRANGGGPGVDGETLRLFEQRLAFRLRELRDALLGGKFEPLPVLRVYVPRPNASNGVRPISLLTVRDRVAQRALHNVLAPLCEQYFLPCSYAFRPKLGIQDVVRVVQQQPATNKLWVVDGDILRCFESLSHTVMLDALGQLVDEPVVLRLVERWLKARVMNEMQPSTPRQGTSQGGILSPLLCNVYLHKFDEAMTGKRAGGRGEAGTGGDAAIPIAEQRTFVRYADDWLIFCAKKAQAEAALGAAKEALQQIGLRVNPDKTHVKHFDEGFCFLGVFFVRREHYWLSASAAKTNDRT
jgi:RNA-directed DNA polymerase